MTISEQRLREMAEAERRSSQHVYNCDTEHVTIPTEEYEKLTGNLRLLQSIEDAMSEYHMKNKLLRDEHKPGNEVHFNSLRRKTITKISQLLRSGT